MKSVLFAALLVVGAQAPTYNGQVREPHPFAPSLPTLTDKENRALQDIVDRFIDQDVGKLKGQEAAKAVSDFKALGPEAIFALIEGLNKAANMEDSCPAALIAKKLRVIIGASKDTALLDFAKENIGADVTAKRHVNLLADLRLGVQLRRTTVNRMLLAANNKPAPAKQPEKAPKSTTVAEPALATLTAVPQDKSVKPGINDPFKDPDLKKYIETFEGESREIFVNRKEIVATCKLKPGMVIADVGAGTGLFTRLFAGAVGPTGKIYAVDISPTFLDHIRKTCKEAGITNVETVKCSDKSAELAPASVDMVFICDTYHHFEFPQRTMASIHKALKPGGQLVLIDFHRIQGKSTEWTMGHVRAGQEVFTQEVLDAGFRLVGQEQLLKDNYFLRFEKK
jgi:precorrin-6B methylase 2